MTANSALAVPERLIALCLCEHRLPLVCVGDGVVAAPDDQVSVRKPARRRQLCQPVGQCYGQVRCWGAAGRKEMGGVWCGDGAYSFFACSRARACPKWNRSKMPADHQPTLPKMVRTGGCRPPRQGGVSGALQGPCDAPSAYILTGLPSLVPAVLEGPSSDRAVQPGMVSSASARTSGASAGIVQGRFALSSTGGAALCLLRALTIFGWQTGGL